MSPKPYFRLYNQSESDVIYWLKNGYKLVAVVPHGENNNSDYNTSYHFIHKDFA